MNKVKILEEENKYHDHFLDVIGNDFKFEHEKGLAEWLKNSTDAYTRLGVADSKQFIVIKMNDNKKTGAVIEVIDFCGMTHEDIEGAFKKWGDPDAARGGQNKKVTGGHGNGGKFYMRQMFKTSHFVTYKNGHLNIFGFNEKRKYGFAEGFKSKKITPIEAINVANISDIFFPDTKKEEVLSGECGFTVVRGIEPEGMPKKIKFSKLINKLRNHPQTRRILLRINVWVSYNNGDYFLLKPDDLPPLPGFESPRVFEIPKELSYVDDGEVVIVKMSNSTYKNTGTLLIRSSEEALIRGSRFGDLNRIDIIGEVGVIGSYQFLEIGVNTFPQASFLYGECECPILEDKEMDCVKNDRTKLVENVRTKALISWISSKIDEVSNEIISKQKAEQMNEQKKISAAFNDYLNKWKDQFMNKIIGDLGRGGSFKDAFIPEDNTSKKLLEAPENGFSFSFPEATVYVNEEKKITLKALSPELIPIGSIVSIRTVNKKLRISEREIIIKRENIHLTRFGESVAVLNFFIAGDRVGDEDKVVAEVGSFRTEISARVIEQNSEGGSKKQKPLQVLLSGTDKDPLGISPGGTLILTERNPVVYQRVQDVSEGIYWINTQSPLAKAILSKYEDHSIRWRDYLFQRYVDIFIKQILHELQKKDPEGFKADAVDNALDTKIMQIHSLAVNDLGKFFFDESFIPIDNEE